MGIEVWGVGLEIRELDMLLITHYASRAHITGF